MRRSIKIKALKVLKEDDPEDTFFLYNGTALNSMGGSVVSVSSWPGGCEFDTRLRRTFCSSFSLSFSFAKACEESSKYH